MTGFIARTAAGAIFTLAGLAGLMPPAAQAAEVHLKFVTLAPPHWVMTKLFLEPWVNRINDQGKGIVHVDRFDGYSIANNGNVYDRVMSDVVQIAWAIPAYAAGGFPLTNIGSLPFVTDDSTASSVAFWRMYKAGDFQGEFKDVHPLMMIVMPQAGLQMASTHVRKPDDLKGIKLLASNRVTSEMTEAVGATPISLNVGEMYQALQRHTAGGVFMPWTAFDPFKLDEVTHYHLNAPLGGGVAMIFMSKKKYDALPAAVRKVIDDNSGEPTVRTFGKLWDSQQHEALEKLRGEKGHTIVTLSPTEYQAWKDKLAPVIAQWEKATPGGAKALQQFRDGIAKVQTEAKK